MCPVEITLAIASIASTAAAMDQQRRAANQQADSAEEAARIQQQTLAQRNQQEAIATTQQMSERQRQYLRERGAIRAATAESGLSGISPLRNLVSAGANLEMDYDTIATNNAFARQQSMTEAMGIAAQRQSRIDSAMASVPSSLGAALQIGMAGTQGYLAGSDLNTAIASRRGTQ